MDDSTEAPAAPQLAVPDVVVVDTLIVSVGGLGWSQMNDIEAMFRKVPRCRVVSAGCWNGYKANLPKLIMSNRLLFTALIGHSMAGEPIIDVIAEYPELVQYAALLDPVSDKQGENTYAMPDNPPKFWWVRRSKVGAEVDFGIEIPLNITNAGQPEIVEGSHNELPHKPEVLNRLKIDILGA